MWWCVAFAAAAEVSAGWGGIEVKGDDASFDAHLMLQARSTLSATDGEVDTLSSSLFRARPMVRFHTGPLLMFFQTELVGTPTVLDARADLTLSKSLTVAGGQMIVPFTRAWNTPLPLVEAPERSVNNSLFAPGRRFGSYALATAAESKLQVWGGVYDNDPNGTDRPRVHAPMVMGRVQVNPLGALPNTELPSLNGPAETRLGIGIAGLADEVDDGVGGDLHRFTGTADFGVQSQGFTSYGEVFGQQTEGDVRGWGASGQVGQFVVPKRLNLGARFSAWDQVVGDELGTRMTPEGVVGIYLHGSNALIDLRYGYTFGGDQPDTQLLTAHTQLRF